MKSVHNVNDRLRVSIVEEYLNEGASAICLSQKYLVPVSSIYRWIRIFTLSNGSLPMKKIEKVSCQDELCALKREIQRLNLELREAQMRSRAFETMIDVAEDLFQIPIRKKAGTKP